MMKKDSRGDFSNKAVVLMISVVIVVSLFSFGVYFNALSNAEPTVEMGSFGKISLNVLKVFGLESTPLVPKEQNGKVGIKVIKS